MFQYKASILFLTCAFLLMASSNNHSYQAENHSGNQIEKKAKQMESDFLTTEEVHEITLSAIGDLLIHDTVYQDAFNGTEYNFSPMLDKVAPFLQQSSITMANQETMIGGKEIGLSSYPTFNSPKQMGNVLQEAGIDIVTIANNHTLDRGEAAIQSAISYWEKLGTIYTGAYKSKKDQKEIRVRQTDGISVAFLAYTYGTNGIPVPDGKDYLVNLIDKQKMADAIAKAKKLSDVIVLSLHFGNEYERMPNQEQKDLVQFAADQGVQVVIGHHPHVLQPVDWVEGKKGNKTFVAYSLGNFLSGQDEFYNRIGGMVRVTIRKTMTKGEADKVKIVSPKFLPTFVDFERGETQFDVIPMYQLKSKVLPDAKKHYKEIKDHMSQWMPSLEFIEK